MRACGPTCFCGMSARLECAPREIGRSDGLLGAVFVNGNGTWCIFFEIGEPVRVAVRGEVVGASLPSKPRHALAEV